MNKPKPQKKEGVIKFLKYDGACAYAKNKLYSAGYNCAIDEMQKWIEGLIDNMHSVMGGAGSYIKGFSDGFESAKEG